MKHMIFLTIFSICVTMTYGNTSESEKTEPNTIFSADWISRGDLWVYKGWIDEPKQYGVQFGIVFLAKGAAFKENELAIVQEVLFAEGPIEGNEKNVWYTDVCSDAERTFKYNLDEYLGGVFTGRYEWDSETPGFYRGSDFPRPIVSKIKELKTPQRAHWKFKTYLVRFDNEMAETSERWRDGITNLLAVIDWEIKAGLFIEPNTGEPNFTALVAPENPAPRAPRQDEIQWNPMPSTKRAWEMLVHEIRRGPRIRDEPNIWHCQYAYLHERYPRKFWSGR